MRNSLAEQPPVASSHAPKASFIVLKNDLRDEEFKSLVESLLRLGASLPAQSAFTIHRRRAFKIVARPATTHAIASLSVVHKVVPESTPEHSQSPLEAASEALRHVLERRRRSASSVKRPDLSPIRERSEPAAESWIVKIDPKMDATAFQQTVKAAKSCGAEVRHQWSLVQYRGFNMRAAPDVADYVSRLQYVERISPDKHDQAELGYAHTDSPATLIKEKSKPLEADGDGHLGRAVDRSRGSRSIVALKTAARRAGGSIIPLPVSRLHSQLLAIQSPEAPPETPTKPRQSNGMQLMASKVYVARLAEHTTPATILLTMQTIRALGARVTTVRSEVDGNEVLIVDASRDKVRMLALLGPIVEIAPRAEGGVSALDRPRRKPAGEWIVDDILSCDGDALA